MLLKIKCILISVHIWSEKFPVPRRLERDIIINVKRSSFRVPVILVRL